MESNYWSGRVNRRTALRGAGVGVLGLSGAALIGCGGAKKDAAPTGGDAERLQGASKVGSQQAEAAGTPVPKD